MNRRALMLGAVGVISSSAAKAAGGIVQQTPMGPLRRVYVAQPRIIRQGCPEWCWAASSSMIFAMHGHPVDQRKIVARAFGGLACSSGQSITIAQVLSSQWIDDNGRPFQASVVAAYDFGDGINAINNQNIVDELGNDSPLLYGNQHHAMVVSQVDYFATPMGPNVQQVSVFDPWPYSPAFHPLSQPEMVPAHMGGQMNFLAAVQVSG